MNRKLTIAGAVALAALAAAGVLHLAGTFDGDASADPGSRTVHDDGNPTGVKVSGVVLDPEGRPLIDAEVALILNESAIRNRLQEGEVQARVQTGRDGEFVFEDLVPEELYLIRAAHSDFAVQRRHPIDPHDMATLRQEIRLGSGLDISGTVTDGNGNPVADAEVQVEDMTVEAFTGVSEPERSVKTGPEGRYRARHLVNGLKKVIARKAGLASDGRIALNVFEGEPLDRVDISLGAGFSISGVIIGKAGDGLVRGALVFARPVDDGGKTRLLETAKTDDNGRFELVGLREARYTLLVKADGFEPLLSMKADAGRRDLSITLAPAASISGFVVDDETGEPVTAFSVATLLNPDRTMIVTPRSRRRFSSADGAFSYLDLRPGTHHLLAEAKGCAGGRSGPIKVGQGQRVSGVIIRVEKGALVSGVTVTAAGRPVAGARVVLQPAHRPLADGAADNPFTRVLMRQMRTNIAQHAVTDVEGRWAFYHVLSGSYSVTFEHHDYADAESLPFTCGKKGDLALDPITLQPGASVHGIVARKDGTPDGKATVSVSASEPQDPFSRTIPTRADGTFEITGLKAGRYSVMVVQREGVILLNDGKFHDQGTLLTLNGGDRHEISF